MSNYPLCDTCGKVSRPQQAKYSKQVMEKWSCPRCLKAGKTVSAKKTDEQKSPSIAATLTCSHCKVEKPPEAFGEDYLQKLHQKGHLSSRALCVDCRSPKCSKCLADCKASLAYSSRKITDRATILCDKCRYPPCAFCQRTPRPCKNQRYDVESLREWYCQKRRCQQEKENAQGTRKH